LGRGLGWVTHRGPSQPHHAVILWFCICHSCEWATRGIGIKEQLLGCAEGRAVPAVLAPGRRGWGHGERAASSRPCCAIPCPAASRSPSASIVRAVGAGIAFGPAKTQLYFGMDARTGCTPPAALERRPHGAGAGKTLSGRTELSVLWVGGGRWGNTFASMGKNSPACLKFTCWSVSPLERSPWPCLEVVLLPCRAFARRPAVPGTSASVAPRAGTP